MKCHSILPLMISEKTLLRTPVKFKNLCYIYPPSVSEIIDEDNFGIYRKLLTISQEEIEDEYVEKKMDMANLLNPLEYILNNAYNIEGFDIIVKRAFQFFIKKEVHLLYEQKMIVIGNVEDFKKVDSVDQLKIIREEDYFDFQNAIRLSLGEDTISPPDPNEHPKIKAMKAKARYRDKIKATSGKSGLTLSTSLISICCMGIGLNPLNIGELSYAAIGPLIHQYQEKEKYRIDIDSLLAGADSKKVKPKYWIRNIDD